MPRRSISSKLTVQIPRGRQVDLSKFEPDVLESDTGLHSALVHFQNVCHSGEIVEAISSLLERPNLLEFVISGAQLVFQYYTFDISIPLS